MLSSILLGVFGFLAAGITVQPGSLQNQIEDLRSKHNIPGAVVIWVQADSTLLFHSYGAADLETGRVISPDSTRLRIGSVSKPFTAIGVLHAAENGLLDLDTDINTYFDEPVIEDHFTQPVTLRHLLTHTPGFDDRFIGKSARTRAEALSLKEAINTMLPRRIMNSGEIASYSNFGVALAGYILEHVSGMPFDEYMKRYVFHPLGMNNSTFDPDDAALDNMITNYVWESGTQQPFPFDYILDAPAGQMVTTASDMNTFLHTILRPNGLQRQGVLSETMQNNMLTVQFTHHPELRGGYGFLWSLTSYEGYPIIVQDGGYAGQATRLMLFPDYDSALFINVNMSDFGFISDVTNLLIESNLPPLNQQAATDYPVRYEDERPLSDFTGTWRHTRYSRMELTKIAVLLGVMGNEIQTHIEADTLLVMPNHRGEPRRLIRSGPLLFHSIDDDYRLAFREVDGKLTHALTDGRNAMERIRLLESRSFHLPLIIGCLGLFLFVTLAYPTVSVYRKMINKPKPLGPFAKMEWGICAAYILGLLLTIFLFSRVPSHEFIIGFSYGVPGGLYVSSLFPYIALLITLILGFKLIRADGTAINRKILSAVIVTVSLVYFVSLSYWNLVGWKF